jgi:type IV secretory pathway TrbL component
MRTSRRGLTVIELVLILLVIAVVIFFLLRLRGRDDAAAGTALDTTAASGTTPGIVAPAPLGAGGALASRLTLTAALDSVASAGDTIIVHARAVTDSGSGVANATVRFVAENGGRVQPDSVTSNEFGDVQAEWILGTAATQLLRMTVPGGPAKPLQVQVRVGGGR